MPSPIAAASVRSSDCTSFDGEQVDAIAWAPSGDTLGVATDSLAGGITTVRSIEWPTRRATEIGRGADISHESVAIDDDGYLYWTRWLPEETRIERTLAGRGRPETVAILRSPLVSGIRYAGGALALRESSNEQESVMLLKGRGHQTIYSTVEMIDSFGLSASGDVLVAAVYAEPGDSGTLVIVRKEGLVSRRLDTVKPSRMTLVPGGDEVLFVDSSTGDLLTAPLAGGLGQTLQRNVTAGELSKRGILAWLPAPNETLATGICFADFSKAR